MTKHIDRRRRWRALLLGSVAVPLGLAAFAAAPPEELLPTPAAVVPKPQSRALTLEQLEQLALENQPAIRAYQASLNAADAKRAALQELHLAGLVRADMDVRKQQADRGIDAADAALRLSKGLTRYSVRRNYWSLVYARQQLSFAEEAIGKKDDKDKDINSLTFILELIQRTMKDFSEGKPGRRDIRNYHELRVQSMISSAQALKEEARLGVERATAALVEAVGLKPDCPFTVTAPTQLPMPRLGYSLEEIEKLALEGREEITQVQVACEVVGLEVEAQKLLLGPSAETFASGSDLHADPIARGSYDGSYRPGGVTIEMPPRLYGQKKSRVDQACHLHERAVSVVDKTRQLILLEARDTYQRYRLATHQAERFEQAAAKFTEATRLIYQSFQPTAVGIPTLEDYLEASSRAKRARLEAAEARYQAMLALIALERITAGAIHAEFKK